MTAHSPGTFRNELARLKKGVRMAWLVNFALLTLTFTAAIVFMFLPTNLSTSGIFAFLGVAFVIASVIAALTVMIVNRSSSKIVMGSVGEGHQEVTEGKLFNIFEELCIAAGLNGPKRPRLYISYGTGVINAYAIADHKGNGRVILTEEILHVLNEHELKAVLGHEIGHITAGDSVDMTKIIALTSVVSVISGMAFRFLGFGGSRGRSNNNNGGGNQIFAIVLIVVSLIFLLVAPLLSKIAQNYMSRQRESQADALSVRYTRDPTPLAYALIKIDEASSQLSKEHLSTFSKKVGELALYAPPFGGKALRTHPPTEERVQNLVNMGAQLDGQIRE